jgi:hypothetical protein
MNLYPEHVGIDFDWDHITETHEIMYLVKRASYEFIFAVPKKRRSFQGEERPFFQVRFKDQCQLPGFILDIEEMEDFYEGLVRLMEYVQARESYASLTD